MGLQSASGGLTKSKLELATAVPGDAVAGKTFYSGDKELKTGLIVDRSAITTALSITGDSTNCYFRLPQGAYRTNATSGYPEVTATKPNIVSAISWVNNTIYYNDSGSTDKSYSTTVYPGYLYLGVVVTRRTDGSGGDASLNVTNSTIYVNLTFDSSTNNSYHKAITKVCLFRPNSNGTFSASCTGGNGWIKNMIGLYRLQ